MNYEQAIKYLFILIGSIYLVTVIERNFGNESHESDVKRRYDQEKEALKQKFYKYEIKKIKEEAVIDGMSNDELDSTWAADFG